MESIESIVPIGLIVIDLQNDFLHPEGMFKNNFIDPEPFRVNLQRLLNGIKFKQVYWIHSNYFTSQPTSMCEHNEGRLAGTHLGKPCCIKGSFGAEYHPAIKELIEDSHMMIEKNSYCAFENTPLNDSLVSNGIKELYVAGVTANMCVMATIKHAFKLGYDITAIRDGISGTKFSSTEDAFELMYSCGKVMRTSDVLYMHSNQIAIEPHPIELYWINGSISSWRVLIALNEKNVFCIKRRVRVMSTPPETRTQRFYAINPRGKAPVLIDNGIRVNESLAILHYLEEFIPGNFLMPPRALKQEYAKVLSLIQESENLDQAYEPIETLFQKSYQVNEVIDAYYRVVSELEHWEHYAKINKFIASNEFTLADCAFYPILEYMVHRGFEFKNFVNLQRYYLMMYSRESVVKSRPNGWDVVGKKNLFKIISDLIDQANPTK